MSSIPNPEKHKLTLELINFDETNSRDELKRSGKGKSEIDQNIEISHSDSYDNDINDDSRNSNDVTDNNNDNDYNDEKEIYGGNKLANTLEASDDVMAFEDSGSDDDRENDDVGSLFEAEPYNLKKKSIQLSSDRKEKGMVENYENYEDDFEKNDESQNSYNVDDHEDNNGDDTHSIKKNKNFTDYGGEAYLDKASKGIDILEQSAINLESWLEDMVSRIQLKLFTDILKHSLNPSQFIIMNTFYSVSFISLC